MTVSKREKTFNHLQAAASLQESIALKSADAMIKDRLSRDLDAPEDFFDNSFDESLFEEIFAKIRGSLAEPTINAGEEQFVEEISRCESRVAEFEKRMTETLIKLDNSKNKLTELSGKAGVASLRRELEISVREVEKRKSKYEQAQTKVGDKTQFRRPFSASNLEI